MHRDNTDNARRAWRGGPSTALVESIAKPHSSAILQLYSAPQREGAPLAAALYGAKPPYSKPRPRTEQRATGEAPCCSCKLARGQSGTSS